MPVYDGVLRTSKEDAHPEVISNRPHQRFTSGYCDRDSVKWLEPHLKIRVNLAQSVVFCRLLLVPNRHQLDTFSF